VSDKRILVLEHQENRAGIMLARLLDPHGHAAIGGDRQVDRHLDTVHRPAQHDALAMQIDDAHPSVRRLVERHEAHRQGERIEPLHAARSRRQGPAGCGLTPQRLSPWSGALPRLVARRSCPPIVAANMPQTGRNPLNVPG
jgi:hypothetical protein